MANLAFVKYPPPTPDGWDRFWFHLSKSHDAIEVGLSRKFGIAPIAWGLYPFFKQDQERILRLHEQAHARFCSLLSIPSHDLSELDLTNKGKRDDWVNLNFLEESGAWQRLGSDMPNGP